MWETVELRELRVFLVLAEELHFGRSAERLGLTQSRVSQSLRELEAKLGGKLVTRSSRHVALTPLGERFHARAAVAYGDLAEVLRSTYAAGQAPEGTLRLGLVGPSAGGPHLTAIIKAFEERHPACTVRVRELSFAESLGALRRGEVDAAAARLPLAHPQLVIGPILSSEPRVLAVAEDHPLARRDTISIEDVADYVAAPISDEPKTVIDDVVPPRTPQGRAIRRRAQRPTTAHELLALVARGEVVHPTVTSFLDYIRHPGVTAVPIHDLPTSRTALVWWRRAGDSRLRELVRVAEELLPREWQLQP